MDITMTQQQNKLHPHKLAMWLAMGSICMMFAGWTSAFIVSKGLGGWQNFTLPKIFLVSTVTILMSSVTMQYIVKKHKTRDIANYRRLLIATIILGLIFGITQFLGFLDMYRSNIKLDGNRSGAFIFVIAGFHTLHVLGGIIALLITYIKSFRKKVKVYTSTGIEVIATYWHFVDALWIYLYIFFLLNFKF